MSATWRTREGVWALCVILWLLVAGNMLWMPAAVAQPQRASIHGAVRDAVTGKPVSYAQIWLEEAARSTQTDANGEFSLIELNAGAYTMHVFRVGYTERNQQVDLDQGESLELVIEMAPKAVQVDEIVVHESREEADQLGTSAFEITGGRLRENLGATIAETLENEPGISMRSMGPAPARPVLRGLGGERLLVLEDGERTGDLSQTSSDHAVAIEPLMSDRIEVVRGPKALLYGPNALGGVVNVQKNAVPNSYPDGIHLDAAFQPQSVNRSLSGGARFHAPVGEHFSYHIGGSVREAGDLRTPEGKLANTDLSTQSASGGLSHFGPRGFAGISGSVYRTGYGIPGGFVGAHPSGVDIEMLRYRLEARSEVEDIAGWIPRLEAKGSHTWYHHEEFEANGTLGIEFGLLSYNASITAHTATLGRISEGSVGLWAEYRDYASGGFSFTPASTEWTVAGIAIQRLDAGIASLTGGIRYDVRRVLPSERFSPALLDSVRARSFGGISASVTLSVLLTRRVSLGLTGMRSIRMPGIEELYSGGPHLAAYSYDIGRPELDLETGLGLEAFMRFEGERTNVTAAFYRNTFRNYIFPRNTGELNYRIYLPIYQYAGADAIMWGGELQGAWAPWPHVQLTASGSYVKGTFTADDQPMPWIPPLQGRLGAQVAFDPFSVTLYARSAATQERLGPFEEPTDGYTIFGVSAEYLVTTGDIVHAVNLAIENISDVAYRNHLSRVKSIMPEPGRNVRLLYRLYL